MQMLKEYFIIKLKQLWKEVKAHRDKGRVAYLSYRAALVKKGENFAK